MNSMSSSTKLLAVFLGGAALAGCNAVEDVSGSAVFPNPANTVVIEGEVSGLSATRPVVLKIVTTSPADAGTSTPSITTTRTLSFRGTNVLRFGSVPAGTTYAITIDTQPYARNCTLANGTGTASADVENVAVTCVPTSVPRFTLSANINSTLAANRPEGFKVTLTTEEGTETIVPNAGQTLVTFTLPVLYPGGDNPPPFNYTVTATNTVGGTTNSCNVTAATGALIAGSGNITTPTVNGCLYTASAAVSYSNTPACTAAAAPNTNCSTAIAAGPVNAIGAGGVKLALRKQVTAEVVARVTATAAGTVTFPGSFPSNSSALYEVIVEENPTGQFCITAQTPSVFSFGGAVVTDNSNQSGGLVNLVNSLANATVQIRCRDVPATANQLKGVYQLDPPAVNPATGAAIAAPRVQIRSFLTFFPNGTFIYGTHPSAALSGVEHGFYNYNAAAGTLQFTVHTDTNGTTANNFDNGLSGRIGYVVPFDFVNFAPNQAVRLGDVTAINVVKTAGAVNSPGKLSLTFGSFSPAPVSPATTPVANYVPTWTMTEPRQTLGQIQGAWTSADSRRVLVYDDVTYYAFHAGVNGAPNLQDQCLTILTPAAPSSFYTRRGGGTGCMGTATANVVTTSGTVSVGTVDVPDATATATSTNTTKPFVPGFLGRLPGTQSTLVTATSPVNYTVTPGTPDTLVIQNTLNAIPVDLPVTFTRATTY